MSSPVQPSSETICVLPPQLLALGEALAPVAKAARQALVRRVRPSGQDFVTLESLSRHMGGIEHALSRLNPRLEGLMSDVIRKEGVGPLEVGRSAGRLEQVLSELVDGYLDAKASHAGAESVEARALRRHKQLIDKGMHASVTALSQEIAERDARDSQRAVAPMSRSEDSLLLDTTEIGPQEACDRVLGWYRQRAGR